MVLWMIQYPNNIKNRCASLATALSLSLSQPHLNVSFWRSRLKNSLTAAQWSFIKKEFKNSKTAQIHTQILHDSHLVFHEINEKQWF